MKDNKNEILELIKDRSNEFRDGFDSGWNEGFCQGYSKGYDIAISKVQLRIDTLKTKES